MGHPAKAPSPPSHSPAKKNVESGNYESFSSAEQRDGDIYSREQSFDKEQNQAPETIPIYANGTVFSLNSVFHYLHFIKISFLPILSIPLAA